MATGEKGPSTGLKPGTYFTVHSFVELQPRAIGPSCESFVPHRPLYRSQVCHYPVIAWDLPVQWAMGDEGFTTATGTDDSWLKLHERVYCRSRVWAQSMVLFPLSPSFWAWILVSLQHNQCLVVLGFLTENGLTSTHLCLSPSSLNLAHIGPFIVELTCTCWMTPSVRWTLSLVAGCLRCAWRVYWAAVWWCWSPTSCSMPSWPTQCWWWTRWVFLTHMPCLLLLLFTASSTLYTGLPWCTVLFSWTLIYVECLLISSNWMHAYTFVYEVYIAIGVKVSLPIYSYVYQCICIAVWCGLFVRADTT